MKTILSLLAFTGLATASPLLVLLTNPNQVAVAGITLTFSGTLTNPAGGVTQFISGDSISLAVLPFDDSGFLIGAPISLASPETSSLFIMFTVDTTGALPNTYGGAIHILGGPGVEDQVDIGSTAFSVRVVAASVPEPSTYLVGLPLLFLGISRRFFGVRRVAQNGTSPSGG